MGLITNLVDLHLNHQHDADLLAQKNYLDMYHTIATDPTNDAEVRRQALMEYTDSLRQAPGKFRSNDYAPKVQKNLQNWYQMAQTNKANQPQPSPPPTQSLASQGPPGGSVPPPPSGNNYGQFAGGPPSGSALGQPIAPSQTANDAMASQGVSVPPPPPAAMQPQAQGVASPAASNFQRGTPSTSAPPISQDFLPYNPFREKMYEATAMGNLEMAKKAAEYDALYSAMSRGNVNSRTAYMNLAKDFIKDMQSSNPDAHWSMRIGANGQPEPVEDQGTPLPRVYPGSQLPPKAKIMGGAPPDPNAVYTVLRYKDGAMAATPTAVPLATGQDADQNAVQFNRYIQGSASNAGAVAPSSATPHIITQPGGNTAFQSVAGAKAGNAPVQTGGINTSMLPSTSTTNIPGQLPQTTTRVKGAGAAAAAPVTRGTPQSTKGPGIPDNSLIGRKYQDWVGGGPAPTGKELTAVQAYAANKNLPSPIQLSAAGQANLQSVDAVFREIDDADRILNKIKGDPSLRADYVKYKLGFHTPNDELFTKLSFEGLRSAAAAMKGNNSRAYPIIQRAFQHVPNLDRAGGLMPDQIPLIKDKLKAMRDVLTDTRNTVLQDERKSGVVGSVPPPPGSSGTVNMKAPGPNGQVSPVPADQVDHYKSLGATVVQ